MSPALIELERIYFQAQQQLNMMLAACKTDDDRLKVRSAYIEARKNYFACVNRAFHDDDPVLEALVEQARTSADELSEIADQLGDITKVINTLTTAVTYGAKIAKMVIGFPLAI